jgi:hypothetical protein
MANHYLNETSVDDLARMLTALVAEVWVMRDRMAVMERLLGEKVGVSSADLDAFVPPADMAAELQRLRDRVIGNVIGAPAAARTRDVDSILAAAGITRGG